jgi:hypothetical protein
MKILNYVDSYRDKVKAIGNYIYVAQHSGVSYHWLTKFTQGSIKNPTIDNIAKLENFFDQQSNVLAKCKKVNSRIATLPPSPLLGDEKKHYATKNNK